MELVDQSTEYLGDPGNPWHLPGASLATRSLALKVAPYKVKWKQCSVSARFSRYLDHQRGRVVAAGSLQ